jgi:hypothetical protein
VPLGGRGTPVPVAVVFDGKGKGGVLIRDWERVPILNDTETGGVNIVNE